jgi:hypothetical protein
MAFLQALETTRSAAGDIADMRLILFDVGHMRSLKGPKKRHIKRNRRIERHRREEAEMKKVETKEHR